ncbi:MAG: isomerase/hydrolase [Oceanospirillaceae bacterium]|nr:isomerase/hydrolase [Oceanospirillaceae bacterium]|tara:strand:+ start:2976 stop:3653 length:678 start_codon:yes stop_codon:yes gene_type:complete
MYIADLNQKPYGHATGKIVCVGRNYAAHAKELNNPVPESPILFIKPGSAAVPMVPAFSIPVDQGEVHHELEIALLIGKRLKHASASEADLSIDGIGLGLDLTLRDVQNELKANGHPWERAKAFDGSCPLSGFVDTRRVPDWRNLTLCLKRNGVMQQQGNTAAMIFNIVGLLVEISRTFTLEPGDIVLTGTPAGVGPLKPGDRLEASLQDWIELETMVMGDNDVGV